MKKIIPLVLFVLIVSFVAFFFLNNGMAMSTLITQDSAKIAETYDKAVKGITGHQNYYFETETKTYTEGNVATTKQLKVSIKADEDGITEILGTAKLTDTEIEVYYVEKETEVLTYVTRTPIGGTPVKTIYTDATTDYVLDVLLEAKPVMFALDGVDAKTTWQLLTEHTEASKEQFVDKASSNFSFSPLGAKFGYKVSDTESYMATIDVLGTLHQISHKVGTETDYTCTTTAFKNYDGKVTIYWKNEPSFSEVTPETVPPVLEPEPEPGPEPEPEPVG